MKALSMVLLFGWNILQGCQSLFKSDTVREFMPGVYTASWKNQFGETRDTLFIERMVSTGSETFHITRRTKFDGLPHSVTPPPSYKIIHWTARYDAGNKTLLVYDNGRVLSFDPEKKELMMGIIAYQKIS